MDIPEIARRFDELSEDRPGRFEEMAEAVFSFQCELNSVYSRYWKATEAADASDVAKAVDGDGVHFPHLPVEAFKHAPVTTFPAGEAAHVFESSGTGRGTPSRHYVKDLRVYEKAIGSHFQHVFGHGPFQIAAHLPGYVNQGKTSSLLYMVEYLTRRFGVIGSGSFLGDTEALQQSIRRARDSNLKLIVFGAAFGLLDFIESHAVRLPPDSLVIETGGMKTYRREIGRADLHGRLARGFGLERDQILSEYGMCELMSQCYTRGGEIFYPPPWMRFEVVDPSRPDRPIPEGEAGALALFDLANLYSVSAILTEDRAVSRGNGFEVLGRLSGSELRGCNFLLEQSNR